VQLSGQVSVMEPADPQLRDAFERDGYVVIRGLFQRDDVLALRAYAASLVDPGRDGPLPQYAQMFFNGDGAVKLIKASGLAEHDFRFNDLATRPELVDVVETLLGPGARRFRDVLVVKPGRTDGALSYHQDSAYWDVEPKALVSAWIGLGDVSEDGSCLSIVPETHTRMIEHALYLRGRHQVPQSITRTLRRLVSFAGTGDNPTGTGGSLMAWKAKRWILAETTKYAPVLFDLQDFRVPPSALKGEHEVFLPVKAGDVIFFHSLLWHASGPNRSHETRFAEIISFMGATARFVGRGGGQFPSARKS
jgi:ectoine hydroxylase-related dioxygenase (phytanoyl-CoA dioxygenase family)